MALNKVEICGVNTSKLPLLSNEEKVDLFVLIKKGDKVARERYIQGNLRLVLSVIKRFSNSNENADDLFQIGCIGLMKAIDNFNTELQVKFSTYAVPMNVSSRNNKENKEMTRKQAVLQAIQELEKNHEMKEVVQKLQEVVEDLPVTVWDEKTIFDAIDQYYIEHGKYPNSGDFQKRGLPSIPSIKHRFGMPLVEFMDFYYPKRNKMKKCNSSVYYNKTSNEWLEIFKEQYYKHNNHNMDDYDGDRDKDTPCWRTMANLNGVTSWNELLKLCDIPVRSQNGYSKFVSERKKAIFSLSRNHVRIDEEELDKLNQDLKTKLEQLSLDKV